MEEFVVTDIADPSRAVDTSVTPKTSEAVNNLIFLSQHSSTTPGGNSEETMLHSESVISTTPVTILKSTLDDIFKGAKAYRCPLCTESNDNPSNLYSHIKFAHKGYAIEKIEESQPSSPGMPYNSSTNRSSKVVFVIKTSKGDQEMGMKHYQCSACEYNNDFTSNVYNHMRAKHSSCQIQPLTQRTSQKPSNINRPKKVFTTGKEVRVLKATKEDVLRGEKMYSCSACGKSSNSTGNLYRHMRKYHKNYSIKMILENYRPQVMHRRREENIPKVQGKIVRIIRSSQEEIDRGDKPYKCSECGKSSDYTGNLYTHMDNFHPEFTVQYFKPPVRYQYAADGIDTDNTVRVITVRQGTKLFYKCSRCCLISPHSGNVYKHMRRIHDNCTIIKRMSSRKRNDSIDDDIIRIAENISKDDNDDVDDENVDNYDMDVNFVSYECCVCMETFNNCDDLDAHVKVHNADGPEDECDEDSDFGGSEVDDGEVSDERENADAAEETVCEDFASKKKCAGNKKRRSGVEESDTDKEDTSNDEGGEKDIKQESNSHSNGGVRTLSISKNIKKRKKLNFFASDQYDDSTSLSKKSPKHQASVDFSKSGAGSGQRYGRCQSDGFVTVLKTTKEEREMGAKYYRCSLCDKASDFTGNLYKHMRSVHRDYILQKMTEDSEWELGTGSKPGRSGRVVEIIVNSPNQNQKGKLYSCSECGLTGNSTSNLYNHMYNKHQGLTIKRLERRNARRTSKSPERQYIRVKSSRFDEGTRSKRGIVTIVKTTREARDMGDKYYRCSLCDKASNFTSNLYKHMRHSHRDYEIQKVTEGTYESQMGYGGLDQVSKSTSGDQRQANKIHTPSKSSSGHADTSTTNFWDWATDS